MKVFNVIVAGPAEDAKMLFIKSMSDAAFRSPEQVAVGKQGGTYVVEFGKSTVAKDTFLYLAGVPMGEQFDFIWERLAEGLLGFVVIFEAKKGTGLAETVELIARLKKLTDTPFVVVLNGLTDKGSPEAVDLRKKLGIPREEQVVCGDLKDKEEGKATLVKLLNLGVKVAKKVTA